MPKISIRAARAGDADVFLDLVDALADYEELERPSEDARDRLVEDGFRGQRRFEPYLAELDGRVVGYAITFQAYSSFLARPTLFLEDIFVLPAARDQGVGGTFFRFLAAEALRLECGRMEWVVLDWNQLAIDFYDRLGARRMSEWLPYRLTRDQLERIAGGAPP